MPIFEIQSERGTFEVEAPNQAEALAALDAATQPEAANSLAGAGKALLSGAGAGLIGLAGLPALAADYGSQGLDYVAGTTTNEAVAPFAKKFGSDNIQRAIEGTTGKFYKPKTNLEQYAHTIGSFLPAVAGGPGSLAARVTTRAVVPGVASEAAGQLAEGTGFEPAARIAGALGGLAGASRVAAAANARGAIPAAPTQAQLSASRTAGYQSQAVRDLEIDAGAANRFVDRTVQALQRDRFSERQAGQTYDLLASLRVPEYGVTHRLQDFDSVRKRLNTVAGAPGTEGEAARRAIRSIDAFTARVPQSAVIAGDARAASQTLFAARGDAAAGFRSQRIQDAIERAQNTAGATHSGGNLENEIRKQFRTMLNSPRQMRGFNDEERAAIRAVAHGGPVANGIRRLGKLLGGGGGLGQLASGGAGGVMFGPAGIVALPAAGLVLNRLGGALTTGRANAADELVRSRSPLYGAGNRAARQAATAARDVRPSRNQYVLQAVLAAQGR